jgi:hypothetical protein
MANGPTGVWVTVRPTKFGLAFLWLRMIEKTEFSAKEFFGTERNKFASLGPRKSLKVLWPGTESNRASLFRAGLQIL